MHESVRRLIETASHSFRAGNLSLAEQACRDVLQIDSSHAAALHLLGTILHKLGRLDEAISSLERARQTDAANPSLHCNLGVVCADAGRLEEAMVHYREALRLKPDFAAAFNNLALASAALGRLAEAMALYREALRCQPDFPAAHNNLGNVLIAQQRFSEAEVHYREALRCQPDYPAALNNLGIALTQQGRPAEAEPHYREALRLAPDYSAAQSNLAGVLIELGRFAEAAACCQEALRADPGSALAYRYLGELAAQGLYHFRDDQVRGMESLLADGRLSRDDASNLHFALADILNRQGQYDRAFAHYRQANDLKEQIFHQKNLAFDPDGHRRMIDELIITFDRNFFERVASFGVDSEVPVFVVGMPRSGTTLVAQILSSHPQVIAAGELRDLQEILHQTPIPGDGGAYPGRLAGLDQATARVMAECYLQRLSRLGGEPARVVDKMPHNYLHLAGAFALFPRARVIHCRRDPRDVCLSCYFQNFAWVNYASNLEHLGFYYRQYERLMRHWEQTLPLQRYEVDYEELIGNPERISRELIAFCGLDWNDRCLAFHENSRTVQTASKLQVRRPIYTTSIGRWKRYEKDLLPLQQALELNRLGGPT